MSNNSSTFLFPHFTFLCLLIYSSFSYTAVSGRFLSLMFPFLSDIFYSSGSPDILGLLFPHFVDGDPIYSIPSFPDNSYQQAPPSLKFFFANHVDIATVPTHPKDMISPGSILRCLRIYITEKVSAQARASNQCTALKLFFSGELLGNHRQV